MEKEGRENGEGEGGKEVDKVQTRGWKGKRPRGEEGGKGMGRVWSASFSF